MNELWQVAIFGFAALLHGMTGMGFPMLGTSALSMAMPLSQAVAMVALPSLLMSLLVLTAGSKQGIYQEIRHYINTYRLLAISSVIGGILGVWLLLILPAGYLYLLMSVVTLYYATHGLLSLAGKAKSLHVPTHRTSMILFGLLAGVVGGATNAMSPILLIFLFSLSDDKNQIAKASNLCYLLGKLVQILMLKSTYAGLAPAQYLHLLYLTIIAMAGLFVGIWLRNKISVNIFKCLIFLVLLLLALKIGHTGITKLT